MRLVAMLARSLGVLLGVCRVLFALRVIAFAMMLGGGTMRFGSILVMFGCLVVFVYLGVFTTNTLASSDKLPHKALAE